MSIVYVNKLCALWPTARWRPQAEPSTRLTKRRIVKTLSLNPNSA